MPRIDLNCDMGEGAGHDAGLMPLITSANIACGGHAGDRETMRTTVALALQHGVGIGAHPGFADREGLGRREVRLSTAELQQLVTGQVESLREFGTVKHVKPHGALYHLAARDRKVAETIVRAVQAIDPALVLIGLAGSEIVAAARAADLRVVEEIFADRTYRSDGSLTPRSEPNAFIADEAAGVAQVLRAIREGIVRATDGTETRIRAETVCLHGDGAKAVNFARRLRQDLAAAGVDVRGFLD